MTNYFLRTTPIDLTDDRSVQYLFLANGRQKDEQTAQEEEKRKT